MKNGPRKLKKKMYFKYRQKIKKWAPQVESENVFQIQSKNKKWAPQVKKNQVQN